jgi:voltage-gated potassium channel Kch
MSRPTTKSSASILQPHVGALPRRHHPRVLWREFRWYALAALVLVALGLGIDGFRRHFDALGAHRSPTDLLYVALQLFTLKSGDVAPPVHWELDVARFLAPAVALSAALQALAVVFRDQVQSLRVRLWGGHVVICGLGRKGLRLAESFQAHGERVVGLESDAQNEHVTVCQARGIPVLIGDATSRALLQRVRLDRAKYLIAVCGDDATNAEIGARTFAFARKDGTVLTAFIHLVAPELCELLVDTQPADVHAGSVRLELFNVAERGASTWLAEHPPFGRKGDHLVVIGGDELGKALVVGAARDWLAAHAGIDRRPRVTLVDPAAERTVELLSLRYPRLPEVCELVPVAISIDSPEFEQGAFLLDLTGRCDVSAVYVCLDEDARGFAAALTLRQRTREPGEEPLPIVVGTVGEGGLMSLADSAGGIHPFSVLDRTCRAETLLSGTRNEVLARAIHAEYVRKQTADGENPVTNPSMVGWDELSEALRESNRRQADQIGPKLKMIGCGLGPRTDWQAPLLELRPDEVEFLARVEHDRWRAERLLDGWTYAAEPKDPTRKTSPYLVPWEQIPEDQRDYDRNTVRSLPAFLAAAGLSAYRLNAAKDRAVTPSSGP